MKILIVTTVYYPDIIGGGEYSLKLVAEGLANRGHNITVECLGEHDCIEEINGVCVIRRYVKGVSESELSHTRNHFDMVDSLTRYEKLKYRIKDLFYNKGSYEYYKKRIIEEKYDVVQSATAMNFMGRYNLWKAAYDLNVPVSHVARSPQLLGIDILAGKINKLYTKIISIDAKYLTAFTAPSQYMIDRHKEMGINVPIMYPIYNSVDCNVVKCSKDSISEKKNIILYAGDLRREKGIFTLREAFSMLDSDAELIYVGSGEEYSTISNGAHIKVIKWLEKEKLYELMSESKIVVLPSEWEEAFGRILIESVYNGTLALGSNRGGIPEVLNDDTRYVFDAGKSKELANRIDRILNLSSEEYLSEICSQQMMMNKFNLSTYIKEWENFFIRQKMEK